MTQWVPGWSAEPPGADARVVALSRGSVLRRCNDWLLPWPDVQPALAGDEEPVYVGQWLGDPVYVSELDREHLPFDVESIRLRDALLFEQRAPAEMLGLAYQVQQWWRDHRYCGRCGQATGMHALERARWCDSCQLPWYPRLAPCVIVVIRRDERMLLARSSRGNSPFFSLIAGFVEPGETLEGAVQREVKEETGLDVTSVQYQASQPWPFPHQLMLGFFADYAGGELVLQQDELAEADWFLPGDLPTVPPDSTIAGRLIRAMQSRLLADKQESGG